MGYLFKGYYFKCCMGDETIAFIPALHESASLQVITNHQAYFVPYSAITFSKGSLKIKMDSCYFSEKGICLDVNTEECQIHGKLKFGKMQRLKYDIMGPFRYLPYMQCRHSVISMQHTVKGEVIVNGKKYQDLNGMGYIEGDRGYSFPKKYLWTQSHFPNGSIMLSVGEIPFCGFCFNGIIGIVLIDGKEYRIATYLGAKISCITRQMVMVRQGKYTLMVRLLQEDAKNLKAPVYGKMERTIQESIRCKVWYCFAVRGKTILNFTGEAASFEYMYY